MPSTTTDTQLRILKNALENAKPPYCSGTLDVGEKSLLLFYGNAKGETGRLDMSKASKTELKRLSEACVPATFGHDQENVLDLSYRKAGKLDEDHFATKLDIEKAGLMEAIRYGLLEGDQGKRAFCAELYKLNVYDKGSFFKAHKDTPRGKNMFGSLVITFPTKHEGGALVLRQGKKEWVFDSGRAMSGKGKGSARIAYAAFFSDVEHEVTLVKSGYRVTLTYNLYFKMDLKTKIDRPLATAEQAIPSDAAVFKAALSSLLTKRSFMKEGGSIGFGLFHQYPIVKFPGGIDDLLECLKGRDAMIMNTCEELLLQADLLLLYDDDRDGSQILSRHSVNPDTLYGEDFSTYLLSNGYDIRIVKHYDGYEPARSDGSQGPWNGPSCDVVWVNDVSNLNVVESTYAAYGNEPSVGYSYANVCLIVDIGPPGDRSNEGMSCDSESL